MNVVLLAAGFGTRIAAVIGDWPKALVEVGGATLLDHLLGRVRALPGVERITLVTNGHFADQFRAWRASADAGDVDIVDDGARSADTRLGAVADLALVLDRAEAAPTLVLASDNLLGFPLGGLVDAGRRGGSVVAVRENPDPDDRRRRGNVELDGDGRVLRFVEKPDVPFSSLSAAPIYLLSAPACAAVGAYLAAGGEADAPGHFMAWLCEREPVHGWFMPGPRLDVGNPESLEAARAALRAEPARYGVAPTGAVDDDGTA